MSVVLTHLNSRLVVPKLQSVQVRNNFTFVHFNNGMYGHTHNVLHFLFFRHFGFVAQHALDSGSTRNDLKCNRA